MRWDRSHNGLMLCTYEQAGMMMPEVVPILDRLARSEPISWWHHLIDVKVHMLMPGMFPCIPNWHRDFCPRDAEGNLAEDFEPDDTPMYLWLSGPPLTEFADVNVVTDTLGNATPCAHGIRQVPADEWYPFTRADWHRGVAATERGWRCFIRVIPREFVANRDVLLGQKRRHSQVYLDAESFSW